MKQLVGISFVLIVPLALLFWKSLVPEMVQFSNDGPLGSLVAEQSRPPEVFFGVWASNNWLGEQAPPIGPTPSFAIRVLSMWKGTFLLVSAAVVLLVLVILLKPSCNTARSWVAGVCFAAALALVAGITFRSQASSFTVLLECSSLFLVTALIYANLIADGL
jgi:hypothetical protein